MHKAHGKGFRAASLILSGKQRTKNADAGPEKALSGADGQADRISKQRKFNLLDGKKGVAQKIVYDAFDKVKETTGEEPLEVFEKAMNNIMPVLEVKARRIGGATYQVPIDVRPDRRQALGLRWLTTFSRARSEKTMEERLAKEIMDAANNTGASVKRKEDMHKMAEANKAFAHYRF